VLLWSFGGAIARSIAVNDSWTIVFWRATWAALFVMAFLIVRNGLRGTGKLFHAMLGPLWVWLIHDEAPSSRTLPGGGMVILALTANLLQQHRRQVLTLAS
jgi:drug/metabolite transporter (DMT)-like permease